MNYTTAKNFKRNAVQAARDAMLQFHASGCAVWISVARANVAAARRYNWKMVASVRTLREWLVA